MGDEFDEVVAFECIKTNKFGKEQRRQLLINTTGKGSLKILDMRGKCKRDFEISRIEFYERIHERIDVSDLEKRTICLTIKSRFGFKDHRLITFVTLENRDAFEKIMARMKIKLRVVIGIKDMSAKPALARGITSAVSNTWTQMKKGFKEDEDAGNRRSTFAIGGRSLPKHSDEDAELLLAGLSSDEEDGPRVSKSRSFDASENAKDVRLRYFVNKVNVYGYAEPRTLVVSRDFKFMRLFGPGGVPWNEYQLKNMVRILKHCKMSEILSLELVVEEEPLQLDLQFETSSERTLFYSQLVNAWPGKEVVPEWQSPLPRQPWIRFDTAKVNRAGVKKRRVLLVGKEKRLIWTFKRKTIVGNQVTTDAEILKTLVIHQNHVQMTKVRSGLRFSVCALIVADDAHQLLFSQCGSDVPILSRKATKYIFPTVSEKERFCAHLNAVVMTRLSGSCQRGIRSMVPASAFATRPGTVRWLQRWPTVKVSLWIGSWNLGDSGPPSTLQAYIPDDKLGLDLYVFGVQESGKASNREAWSQAILRRLQDGEEGRQYRLVGSVNLWEMAMWVWCKGAHLPDMVGVVTDTEATGISLAKKVTGKQLGNKGGIGIGFQWGETRLCFINSHLAARPSRVKHRAADYRQIASKLRLGDADTDLLHTYDHIFWFGDLNYRVTLPFHEVTELVLEKKFPPLLEADQLKAEKQGGRAFVGFSEAPIAFPPTYRWQRGFTEFSNKKNQSPSYTDRILWRSMPAYSQHISAVHYSNHDSDPSVMGSDHRPISASFDVRLRAPYSMYSQFPLDQISLPDCGGKFFSSPTVNTQSVNLPPWVPCVVIYDLQVVIFAATAALAPSRVSVSFSAPFLDKAVGTSTVDALNDGLQSDFTPVEVEESVCAEKEALPVVESLPEAKDEVEVDSDDEDHEIALPELGIVSGEGWKYRWPPGFAPTAVPPLYPFVWDPMFIGGSHLRAVVRGSQSGGTPITLGYAVLPMNESCDATAEVDAGESAGNGERMLAEPVLFKMDVCLGAVKVGKIQGRIALRSAANLRRASVRHRNVVTTGLREFSAKDLLGEELLEEEEEEPPETALQEGRVFWHRKEENRWTQVHGVVTLGGSLKLFETLNDDAVPEVDPVLEVDLAGGSAAEDSPNVVPASPSIPRQRMLVVPREGGIILLAIPDKTLLRGWLSVVKQFASGTNLPRRAPPRRLSLKPTLVLRPVNESGKPGSPVGKSLTPSPILDSQSHCKKAVVVPAMRPRSVTLGLGARRVQSTSTIKPLRAKNVRPSMLPVSREPATPSPPPETVVSPPPLRPPPPGIRQRKQPDPPAIEEEEAPPPPPNASVGFALPFDVKVKWVPKNLGRVAPPPPPPS